MLHGRAIGNVRQRINVGVRGKDDERVFVPRGRMVKRSMIEYLMDSVCPRQNWRRHHHKTGY